MWYWVFDLNLPLLLLLNGSSVWVWVMCWIANPGHSVWAIRHIFTNKSNQKPLWVSTTLQGFKQLWSSLWEPQRRHERGFYFIFFFCSVLFVGFVFFWGGFFFFFFVSVCHKELFFFKCQTLQRVLAQTLMHCKVLHEAKYKRQWENYSHDKDLTWMSLWVTAASYLPSTNYMDTLYV